MLRASHEFIAEFQRVKTATVEWLVTVHVE